MIVNQTVQLKKRGNKNLKYYQNLGYIINDIFEINIKDLTPSSKVLVDIECDICKKIVKRSYNLYLKNISSNNIFSCSSKCGKIKTIKTNLEKYGVEYPTKNKDIIKKIKKTNLEKYGVDNISKLEKTKNKVRKTNLEKYGVEHALQSELVKEKAKKTLLEKYGVDHNMKLNLTKDMVKQTNLERYGVDNISKLDDIKKKKKETLLKNWGVDSPLKSELIKNKVKNTNLSNLGVYWPMQSDLIKLKSKETLLEKYGVEHNTKSDIVKNNIKISNIKKYGVEHTLQIKKVRDSIINTNIMNWGETHPSKSELYRKDNFIMSKDNNYIEYNGDNISSFICNLGHVYKISSSNYHSRRKSNLPLCTICNPIGDSSSIKENELYNYILSIYDGVIIKGYKDKLEIDIYLPELNIGFEFNGLYWHSEKNKEKNYHSDKSEYFYLKGINLIHIWEDDWDYKLNIIKNKITKLVNPSKLVNLIVNIDDFNIKYVESEETMKFIDENDIEGYTFNTVSTVNIGLYYNNKLISIMLLEQKNNNWYILRFCDKIELNVSNSYYILLDFFTKKYNPLKILIYVNRDWIDIKYYQILGFVISKKLKPDFKYIIENKRIEKNIQINNQKNINKVYDSGKILFKLNLK